jgi:hypothetical protein
VPTGVYGFEICSLTFKEEHRVKLFEKRVLRKIFWPKCDKATGYGGKYLMNCFMISAPHQILLGKIKPRISRWAEHVARRGEMR